jgi:hypothetical protein
MWKYFFDIKLENIGFSKYFKKNIEKCGYWLLAVGCWLNAAIGC